MSRASYDREQELIQEQLIKEVRLVQDALEW